MFVIKIISTWRLRAGSYHNSVHHKCMRCPKKMFFHHCIYKNTLACSNLLEFNVHFSVALSVVFNLILQQKSKPRGQPLWSLCKCGINCAWNDGQLTRKPQFQWDLTSSCITKQCELGRLLIWFLIFFGSAIRISRKGWHMLLNFCFHTALTFAVFAGGINRIKYPIICQAVSAFPFHSSSSQSLTENWLRVSAQVSVATAVFEGRMYIIWSLVYCHADTMIPGSLPWPNPLSV